MHKDAAFLEHILDAIIAIDKFTFGIDLNIVWRAITEDLQPLKKAILSWKETQ